MGKDSSEERNLPASQKKLRDARKKGQVPKSKDLTTGMSLAVCILYLLLAGGTIVTVSVGMLDRAGQLAAGDFQQGVSGLLPVIGQAAATMLLPLLLAVPATVVLTSMVMLQGIPFAIDPIVPKLEKLNPIEGFGRLFKMRSLVDLIKSLAKTVLIVAVFLAVFAGGLRALVLVPIDGLPAEIALLRHLALPILASAALMFVAAGVLDIFLQRWLFFRDQKMSISESKRERKDMDGDPHVRRERRRIMREAVRLAGGLGLKRTTLLIHDGGQCSVGLRFIISEMSAPVVVCRARGEAAAAMISRALEMHVPAVEDAELAEQLARVPMAHGIPEPTFRPVSLALRRAGVV